MYHFSLNYLQLTFPKNVRIRESHCTRVVIFTKEDGEDIGVSPSILFLSSLDFDCVCGRHCCNINAEIKKWSLFSKCFPSADIRIRHESGFLHFCSRPRVAPVPSSSSLLIKASSTGTSSLAICPSSSSTASQRLQGKKYLNPPQRENSTSVMLKQR